MCHGVVVVVYTFVARFFAADRHRVEEDMIYTAAAAVAQ